MHRTARRALTQKMMRFKKSDHIHTDFNLGSGIQDELLVKKFSSNCVSRIVSNMVVLTMAEVLLVKCCPKTVITVPMIDNFCTEYHFCRIVDVNETRTSSITVSLTILKYLGGKIFKTKFLSNNLA